jgi:hypothetical protein
MQLLRRQLCRDLFDDKDGDGQLRHIDPLKLGPYPTPDVVVACLWWIPKLIGGKKVLLVDSSLQKHVASFLASKLLNWLETLCNFAGLSGASYELRRLNNILSHVCSAITWNMQILTLFVAGIC